MKYATFISTVLSMSGMVMLLIKFLTTSEANNELFCSFAVGGAVMLSCFTILSVLERIEKKIGN